MNRLRKFHLSLIAFLFSAAMLEAAQAHYQYLNHGIRGGLYASVEGFYAQGVDALLDTVPYAVSIPTVTPFVMIPSLIGTDFVSFYNQPKEKWGYQLSLGYDAPSCNPCCNYGISLDYTYFRGDKNSHTPEFVFPQGSSFAGEPNPTLFIPYVSVNFRSIIPSFLGTTSAAQATFSKASSHFNMQYDTVDLLGYINRTFCRCVEVQFFGGARYLYLKENIRVDADFNPGPNEIAAATARLTAISNIEEKVDTNNKFTGIGPRLGISAYFPLPYIKYFGIVAEGAGNLTYGDAHSHYLERAVIIPLNSFTSGTIDTPSIFTTLNQEKHHIIVPSLSGKVGIALNLEFRNCSCLAVEAGYRTDKYFQILNNSGLVSSVLTSNIYFPNKNNEFDLGGPYISVTWHV